MENRIYKDKIENILNKLSNVNKEISDFANHFFSKMPYADIINLDISLGAEIVKNAFEFIQKREINKPKIRIFSIDNNTILEIINDDMPFLVDSVSAEIINQGLSINETIHPIFYLKRDSEGNLEQITENINDTKESFIHLHISSLFDDASEKRLISDIRQILNNVYLTVNDWQKMLSKAGNIRNDVIAIKVGFNNKEIAETGDFMNWLCEKNFVMLGYIEYNFYDKDGKEKLQIVENSELGIYKASGKYDIKPKGLVALPKEMRHFAILPNLIEITKTTFKSVVHRSVPMDYIGIKRVNAQGKVIGECRFVGLFTSIVYYQSADNIPFIRTKIANTLKYANYDPAGHNGKALRAILEFFPRDELFQINDDDLFEISLGVMALEARPKVRVFTRTDTYERFVSCFVYMPRDKFNTSTLKQIIEILNKAYNGTISGFYTQMTDSPLARLHLIIRTIPTQIPKINLDNIEDNISTIVNNWTDSLYNILAEQYKDTEHYFRIFNDAFPKSYSDIYSAEEAVFDIKKIMDCKIDPEIHLFLPKNDDKNDDDEFHLKIYTKEQHTALSDILPILENMGLYVIEVHPFVIKPAEGEEITIHDFSISLNNNTKINFGNDKNSNKIRRIFEEALQRIWRKEMTNDAYNKLILSAGLAWRQVETLRAYGKYIKQAGLAYNETFIAESLFNYPTITALLVKLFETRFAPDGISNKFIRAMGDNLTISKSRLKDYKNRNNDCLKIRSSIDAALSEVSNLSEDIILRRFADVTIATLRTNFFQPNEFGLPKDYVSLKLDSAKIPELPLPCPYAEIFVYSRNMEAIHLRGGKVARGGLRWSDRNEDFRTEVLGLMKAQMVKNTVIVPVGSKGGFVVKIPSKNREEFLANGIKCYKQFLSGMLDITDNIINGEIVPPKFTICHDGDDPYLVVAADKGTATFSDIANSVSQKYNFWLGDAFASGGSAGYDHKKMGITAKGAWLSVERHFREINIDTNKQDFTVIGIGDMSGDVFGNGMLLSKHINLIAAFNHRHIFIDPNPNIVESYSERERLFALPSSGWNDYNEQLISAGGGVFDRSAKIINLSKEMRKMLDTHRKTTSPDELIRLILKCKADLLWNGGIGTYVKSEDESNSDAGDRTNDFLRINGAELRCSIVGEGGNLGLTQLGRTEYASIGGRINTDAIDNSAGVDCSDHEVNIKIALSNLDEKIRNPLLESMTDDVASLVLADNFQQTNILTISENCSKDGLEQQTQMMHILEKSGLLNREVEFLPSDKKISSLKLDEKGLTRPELAVLLSYAKLSIYENILSSNLPDATYFEQDLINYFPKAMRKKYLDNILKHRLRREITATIITNDIVNHAGIAFFHSAQEETGRKGCDIARAYIITRDAFGLQNLWQEIENADISTKTQTEIYILINHFLERSAMWFLRNCPQPLDICNIMQDYADPIIDFSNDFLNIAANIPREIFENTMNNFIEKNVNEVLAEKIAMLTGMNSATDIVKVANITALPITIVGKIYYDVGMTLQLGWLRASANKISPDNVWDKTAIKTIISDLFNEQQRLTLLVIEQSCSDDKCEYSVDIWQQKNLQMIEKYNKQLANVQATEIKNISMLILTLRNIRNIGD